MVVCLLILLTLNDSAVAAKQEAYCNESTLNATLGELLDEEEELDEEDELNDEDVTDEDEDEDAVLAVWDALVIYKLDGSVND